MGDQSVLGEATSAKSDVFPEELKGNDENLPPNDDMVFEEVEKSRKNYGYEFLIAESRFDFWIKALMLRKERKVKISQKYTLVSKNTEFPKLKSLVDRLQVNNELDADTIRDDYADIFQGSEDAESLNLSSLDLLEFLWDVSLLSTNENTTKSFQP
ncbi:Hypothetical predicted protein [Paramuricea clavata]|uniref:Uncharacterized protein n=1 Tax=Paramuricea clavata TaxID=317549 RepID=A0A6S7IGC6_PARCT|nr:Hypothetical predicted protein [Paramuricea clavata]